eukprot:11190249-Ditylum_brightwellii.AAC.1
MGFDFRTLTHGALPLQGILASSHEATPQHLGMNHLHTSLTAMMASLAFNSLSLGFAPAETFHVTSTV